jgi:hypothetical protein
MGTPHYMSPEQASGRVVDLRADIYGMGIILFECATGQKPFVAESLFDLLRMHLEATPPSPRALRPDMPVELERVILTALAKAPDHRFASAEAMSLALQHATTSLAPEQWAPITGGSGRSISGGAWSPTPPQSWNRPPQHPPPPASSQNQSTLSAGQVSPASPQGKSRKGLWIGVFAILLVGGGITAAVVAGGGGAKDVAAADSPKDKPDKPDKQADKQAKPADKPDKQAKPDKAEKADKQAKPDKADRTGKADKPDKDDDDLDEAMRTAEREMTEQLKQLPADFKAAMHGAANPGGGSWFSAHPLQLPGYDPKHADVAAFIPWAIAQAKKVVPDAALFRIGIDGLYADGHADLTLPSFASDTGQIELRFVSPSRTARDPKVPLGVTYEFTCELRVEAGPTGIEIRPISNSTTCKDAPIATPRCSPAAVWKKAIAKKPALNGANAVTELSYYGNPVLHQVRWFFDIKDVFDEMFPDDC